MDSGPGVNTAALVVPSHWPGASCPSNILPGACTRCGRGTELGSICRSCAAGGPCPGAAIPVGPSTIKLHPTANCTACRVPLRVPSHLQTAHVLCSPCQALHAAIVSKPNPRDRAAPRVNPYPVVPPRAKTPRPPALALAFTYPNLPALPPTSASASGRVYTSVSHREGVLRVCMRFGCGARLPAHVPGNMCEACAGVAFIRPPPAAVPKRVPRRATERACPRPRESLDLVRTVVVSIQLLSREAVHGARVTTEGKDVENELGIELIYPDDTPVATQHASTTSEHERKEFKPIEDEDVELELVYPEDAAKATYTPSLKPQTRPSPPTTLRELFMDGLRTIPALQNLAAFTHKSPPRRCRMPGCNETLPAQTCMQRCVKCTVGDWKRRRLAAKDTLDPLRRLSTTSLTTHTSMEEMEVTNTLDEISDVESGSDLPPPPPPPSPSKGSSSELTGGHGINSIPGRDSDLTGLSRSDSDTESMSDSGSEPDLRLASLHGGSLLRKCRNQRCNIALPKDHRWKTCDPCRRAQRIRFENKRSDMVAIEGLKSPDFPCRRRRSFSPDMRETDVTLTPETSRPCSVKQCRNRVPLTEVYGWKTCASCRARARRERNALLETQHASCQPEIVPRFPAYQNRGALLSSFEAQVKGFVEGQIMYLLAKLHDNEGGSRAASKPWKSEHTPVTFVFMGEYSIVTGQRDDRGRSTHRHDHPRWPDKPAELDAMRQEVSSIVLDLECILRAKFRAGEAFAIDKGGIIMRFTSELELITQVRPLTTTVGLVPPSVPDSKTNGNKGEDAPLTAKPPPSPPAAPLVKTFSGELEAVVVPDEAHRLFHGRRTVIRYRMVG